MANSGDNQVVGVIPFVYALPTVGEVSIVLYLPIANSQESTAQLIIVPTGLSFHFSSQHVDKRERKSYPSLDTHNLPHTNFHHDVGQVRKGHRQDDRRRREPGRHVGCWQSRQWLPRRVPHAAPEEPSPNQNVDIGVPRCSTRTVGGVHRKGQEQAWTLLHLEGAADGSERRLHHGPRRPRPRQHPPEDLRQPHELEGEDPADPVQQLIHCANPEQYLPDLNGHHQRCAQHPRDPLDLEGRIHARHEGILGDLPHHARLRAAVPPPGDLGPLLQHRRLPHRHLHQRQDQEEASPGSEEGALRVWRRKAGRLPKARNGRSAIDVRWSRWPEPCLLGGSRMGGTDVLIRYPLACYFVLLILFWNVWVLFGRPAYPRIHGDI